MGVEAFGMGSRDQRTGLWVGGRCQGQGGGESRSGVCTRPGGAAAVDLGVKSRHLSEDARFRLCMCCVCVCVNDLRALRHTHLQQ